MDERSREVDRRGDATPAGPRADLRGAADTESRSSGEEAVVSEWQVERLWIRPAAGAAMQEQPVLRVHEGRGAVGDHGYGSTRQLTLLMHDDWAAAERELGHEVDPAGRRANVLLSGGDARRLLGAVVRIGDDVRIEVRGVTAPCEVMEAAARGLRAALEPAARAGVWGRVLAGGTIGVGDTLHVEPASGARG